MGGGDIGSPDIESFIFKSLNLCKPISWILKISQTMNYLDHIIIGVGNIKDLYHQVEKIRKFKNKLIGLH